MTAPHPARDYITIVSGLPRSGTSMAMAALAAGGIEPLIDHVRGADEDNPRGYYEFERVKKVKEDTLWLEGRRPRRPWAMRTLPLQKNLSAVSAPLREGSIRC